MEHPTLSSILLSSKDPERLNAWYVEALQPEKTRSRGAYRLLKFGDFTLVIDTRADIGDRNPEPGRVIYNYDVPDARATVERLNGMGVEWVSEMEDRDGNLVATCIDPDGNYVQVFEMSEEGRRQEQEGWD